MTLQAPEVSPEAERSGLAGCLRCARVSRAVSVPSLSGGGRYRVAAGTDGVLDCTCPRYAFSRRGAKRCRHTDIVSAADRFLARCRETHQIDCVEPILCRACLVALLAAAAKKAREAGGPGGARRRRGQRNGRLTQADDFV